MHYPSAMLPAIGILGRLHNYLDLRVFRTHSKSWYRLKCISSSPVVHRRT